MTIKKKLVLAVALIAVTTLAALIFATPPEIPEEPLPSPNGYDDFVQVAAVVEGNTSDWNILTIDELRRLVATNHAAITLIRTGLTKQCRVVPWSFTNSNHLDTLSAQKRGAHALCAASRLELLDGRTNEAALTALDCVRYGEESGRGGVVIDALVGIAVKSLGRARLEVALPGVDGETARKILAALQDADERRELPADIIKRDAQWARLGRFGPSNFFTQFIQPMLNRKALAKAEQKFVKAATDLQRTKLRAAARAYELDHGQPPATARDLVPQYLKAIPLDPATGLELPLN